MYKGMTGMTDLEAVASDDALICLKCKKKQCNPGTCRTFHRAIERLKGEKNEHQGKQEREMSVLSEGR